MTPAAREILESVAQELRPLVPCEVWLTDSEKGPGLNVGTSGDRGGVYRCCLYLWSGRFFFVEWSGRLGARFRVNADHAVWRAATTLARLVNEEREIIAQGKEWLLDKYV